jgi:hypothetical protein
MRNSSNCHSGTLNEIKDLMMPGIMMANVNCSILSQTYADYTNCPIVGNCSVAKAMDQVMESIARSTVPGASPCG